MAAITKRLLQLRPTFRSQSRPYPYTQHYFSSDDRDNVSQSEQSQSQPSDSSNLNTVRASLRDLNPLPDRRQTPSRGGSRDEISSRLAEFRYRSAPPPPKSGSGLPSIQEMYKNKNSNSKSSSGVGAGGRLSVDSFRESLSKLQSTGDVNPGKSSNESWSLSLMSQKKNKADSNADGGSEKAFSPYLKGIMGQGAGGVGSRKMEFGKKHDRSILGDKLKAMRPEKRKGKWFSLQELRDRLAEVRVADQKEVEKAGPLAKAVHESFQKIAQDNFQQKKEKARSFKQIGLLGSMAEETGPPKDHLVEKYFHPDNMSSAEKMKLELQKVRDEFKMSESDCGSARVQVAQLTTKIKHLSTALHKKDKHSRKGLHEMVQRRKKLLKYLRRTDWDSYCFVLSKLGLRDNPDIKA